MLELYTTCTWNKWEHGWDGASERKGSNNPLQEHVQPSITPLVPSCESPSLLYLAPLPWGSSQFYAQSICILMAGSLIPYHIHTSQPHIFPGFAASSRQEVWASKHTPSWESVCMQSFAMLDGWPGPFQTAESSGRIHRMVKLWNYILLSD